MCANLINYNLFSGISDAADRETALQEGAHEFMILEILDDVLKFQLTSINMSNHIDIEHLYHI